MDHFRAVRPATGERLGARLVHVGQRAHAHTRDTLGDEQTGGVALGAAQGGAVLHFGTGPEHQAVVGDDVLTDPETVDLGPDDAAL